MRITGWVLLLVGLMGGGMSAAGQSSAASNTVLIPSSDGPEPERTSGPSWESSMPGASLFYVAGGSAVLHNLPRSDAPTDRLSMRTPVTRLGCKETRCRVRTDDGQTGYVAASALSNVWIRVVKAERRLYVYRGHRLVHTFDADMAYNSFADKRRSGSRSKRDHWRTPEGTFYVVHKNPDSEFYKALVLNYPKIEDARRGLKNGLISRSQYEAIKEAQQEFRIPPMNTDLGGWIEIHGDGTGAATAWTQGCVAVRNGAMDVLWEQVRVGTPVLVE
ncbi:MAG: murein L,D-transpeptidase family protein [Salinibacter sp.]